MKKFTLESPPSSPSVNHPTRSILYVEDEDSNWDIAVARMKNRYHFMRAANSAAACECVRNMGSQLSAILMDIQLQGSDLDGIQLTRLFTGAPISFPVPDYAQNLPPLKAPILFVTANDSRYEEGTLLKAGAKLIIPKPVDFVKLTVALNSLLLSQMKAPS